MIPALLHLDEALTAQRRLRQAVVGAGGRLLDYRDIGPSLRLWTRPAPLERLRRRLASAVPYELGPVAVFSGSGDFHHVAVLLIERALGVAGGGPITVVHFDNHPDWVRFERGAHCGSWVGLAARLPGVAKVITVGVCSGDIGRPQAADLGVVEDGRLELYPYRAPGSAPAIRLCGREWPAIEAMGENAFADFLPGRVETESVYVTIDKDVLRRQDAATNWDQGATSLDFLKTLITRVAQGRRLVGADVVGDWSKALYGGDLLAPLLKQAVALLDQPWRAPATDVCAANEAVNLELLDLLQEVGR